MPWYDLLNIGLLILVWIPIFMNVAAIASNRKYWLFFFTVYTLTELVSLPISLGGESNLWVYSVSKPIQFLLLIAYLSKSIKLSRMKITLLLSGGVILSVFLFFSQEMDTYHSHAEALHGAIIVALCVMYFYKFIAAEAPIKISKSEFWYCSSLFVFYGTNLWINGSLDFLIENNLTLARKLFFGLVINSYIFYALTLNALLVNYQRTR